MYICVRVAFLSYSESEKDTKTSKDDRSKVVASVVEQLIQPEGANVTGDRGNPHYAKELQEGNKPILTKILTAVYIQWSSLLVHRSILPYTCMYLR